MARGDLKQRIVFEVEDRASAPSRKIQDSFAKIKGAAIALGVAGAAGKALSSFTSLLKSASAAAIEQERVTRRVEQSLRALGPAAREYTAALAEQADQLQRLGVGSNEQIQSVQALIAEFGVAPSKIDETTEAAANLSVALGISLESAARNVARTVGGFAGELGEVIPELKELSAESLKAGEGIDLIAEKFAGGIQANAQTAAASLTRLNEAFADTNKALGSGATTEGAIASTNRFANAVEKLNERIAESVQGGALGRFQEFLFDVGFGLTKLTQETLEWAGVIEGATGRSNEWKDSLDDLGNQLDENTEKVEENAEATEKAAAATQEYIDAMRGVTKATNEAGTATARYEARVGEVGVDTERAAVETERLTEALLGERDALRPLTSAAREYKAELQSIALTSARTRAAAAFSGSVRARSSSQQAVVDAALAAGNRPFLGGTRIKVPGGSRLVDTN